MRTKLFISSDLKEETVLAEFCKKKNWELTAKSQIDFLPLNFIVRSDYDVVFFSSPRSFNYFIRSSSISDSAQIAVLGSGTLKCLNELNSRVFFTGKNSGNPEEIAESFRVWLGERKVLFPLALHSNETISSRIPEDQKEVVRVYETIDRPNTIPEHDLYVFTSPSNLRSFLSLHKLPVDAKTIAWGTTTQQACAQHQVTVWKTLDESSLEALVDVLQSFVH